MDTDSSIGLNEFSRGNQEEDGKQGMNEYKIGGNDKDWSKALSVREKEDCHW